MFLRHFIVFSFIALLAGCAGFGARESVEGQGSPAQWKQHKAQLSSIDGWQIEGKVGVRAPKDSGSGTLFWLQRQDYFDIRLSGPLGRGAARLTGRPGRLVVCGDAGDALGDSLYETHIYVKGKVESLGSDCIEKEMRAEHLEELQELLNRAGFDHKAADFKRYGSARQLYNFKVDNASAY